MSALTIPLSEELLVKLRSLADQSKSSAEELARDCLQEWLSEPRRDFKQAAEYVLRKNRELYKRLAQ